MKTVIWSFLLCVLFAANATAQPGPAGSDRDREPPSPEDRVERLREDLNLDEDQSAALLDIFTATDEQREALRHKHKEQIRQDVCALHNRVSEQIKSVLTEQQSAEFDQLMVRRESRHSGHHRRPGRERWPFMNCEKSSS